MRTVVLLTIWLLVSGFAVKDAEERTLGAKSAKAAMEAYGFKDIKIIGPMILGCGRDDAFRIEFEAIAPGGQRVKAQACGGLLFKGWTVRIDEVLP